MKDTLAIRQDTAHSTPPVFHPTDCKLSTMNAVHVLSCIASFWHHHQNPANLTLYRSFCFKRLSMIYFRFSLSIQDGVLPPSQKRSILPVLKRSGLDSTDPLNFRPIANVSFMSKIIEEIAAYQLTVYIETNKLLPECQSGFRRGHSTETLLLHLLSDIHGAVNSSQLTLLALFDVSVAFDTVDG